jgi:hypothetical protein
MISSTAARGARVCGKGAKGQPEAEHSPILP